MTKRRMLWLLAIVAVAALAITLVVVSCGSGKRSTWAFTVNDSKVTVDAALSGGEIVAKPATGTKPAFKTIKSLGTPVNLEIKGGSLEGRAKVSFAVDPAKLPKGIDPEAWLSILVRSERTGGKWRWAGGEYDAAAKTISVETEHFSDWVVGYTDFNQINADLAWSKDSSYGARIGRTIWGAIPALACKNTDGQIGLTYSVKDDSPPPVKVCYTRKELRNDPAKAEYYLEIVNPHPFPFLLTLPKGLKAKTDWLTGAGIVSDAYALGQAILGTRTVLPAEGKATFTAFETDFNYPEEIPQITATVDFTGLGVDVTSFLVDYALADIYEASGDDTGQLTKDLRRLYEETMKNKQALDCLDKQAAQLKTDIEKSVVRTPVEVARDFAVKCYDATAGPLLEYIGKQIGVASKNLKALSKRFSILLSAGDIMKGVRQYGAGMIVGLEELDNKNAEVGFQVSLLGKFRYKELYEVLPTEGIEGRRDYSDYRSSDPVMPYNCAAGPLRVASAPEPDPYIGELSRRAAANYTIDGWSSGVGLYRVLSKHQDAWSYVAGMKDQCHDAYPDGSPKSPRYKLVEEGTEGDVHKVYLRSWDGGLPDSYVSLTYSNGYLLMAGFGPTDRKDALKAFAAERKRIGETIDRYLVTTFSR